MPSPGLYAATITLILGGRSFTSVLLLQPRGQAAPIGRAPPSSRPPTYRPGFPLDDATARWAWGSEGADPCPNRIVRHGSSAALEDRRGDPGRWRRRPGGPRHAEAARADRRQADHRAHDRGGE